MPLSNETRAAAERLVMRYPVARSALLPLLHLVQADEGYVTEDGIAFCAELLGLTKAEVGAVSTFYTMFKREPVGDYLISICTNPTCKHAGAQDIYERFQDRLGGHHDPDTGVSVEHAECLGICDAAPVIQVNYEMYGPLPEAEVDALLEGCRKGEPPVSNWSNERPRTFREVEWELSGAGDPWGDELARASRQQVEADVPPAYRTGETDLPVTHPGGDPRGHGGQVFRERAGWSDDGHRGAAADSTSDGPRATGRDVAAASDLAGEGGGVAEEMVDQVAGQATDPTPAAGEQPATSSDGATERAVPAEQASPTGDGGTAAGDEQEAD